MSEKMAFSTGGNACCPILAFVPAKPPVMIERVL